MGRKWSQNPLWFNISLKNSQNSSNQGLKIDFSLTLASVFLKIWSEIQKFLKRNFIVWRNSSTNPLITFNVYTPTNQKRRKKKLLTDIRNWGPCCTLNSKKSSNHADSWVTPSRLLQFFTLKKKRMFYRKKFLWLHAEPEHDRSVFVPKNSNKIDVFSNPSWIFVDEKLVCCNCLSAVLKK